MNAGFPSGPIWKTSEVDDPEGPLLPHPRNSQVRGLTARAQLILDPQHVGQSG